MTMNSRVFQIFVKPVGASCNLRCSYCYYLAKKNLYPESSLIMNDQLLEKYIIQHIKASTDATIMFSWHGGEPTLAGIDFFRKAIALQKKHIPEGKNIINGIQTNGVLLNDEWCRFFSDEKFLVGISIDGPEEIHNMNRRNIDGIGSFSQTMRGYELLIKHEITTEILCVLNSGNVRYPHKIYNFFRDLCVRYITFLPLVEQQHGSTTAATDESVNAIDYAHFLCDVFDVWVANDIGKISIQIFEELAITAFKREHTLCIFKVNCGGVPVIEHNGDFFSCDHYVDHQHLIGNINEGTIAEFLDCKRQQDFGKAKSLSLPVYCLKCEVRDMCNGECPKNRFILTPDGEPGLNYLCEGYKLFFNHCRPFVEALRKVWTNEKQNQ